MEDAFDALLALGRLESAENLLQRLTPAINSESSKELSATRKLLQGKLLLCKKQLAEAIPLLSSASTSFADLKATIKDCQARTLALKAQFIQNHRTDSKGYADPVWHFEHKSFNDFAMSYPIIQETFELKYFGDVPTAFESDSRNMSQPMKARAGAKRCRADLLRGDLKDLKQVVPKILDQVCINSPAGNRTLLYTDRSTCETLAQLVMFLTQLDETELADQVQELLLPAAPKDTMQALSAWKRIRQTASEEDALNWCRSEQKQLLMNPERQDGICLLAAKFPQGSQARLNILKTIDAANAWAKLDFGQIIHINKLR